MKPNNEEKRLFVNDIDRCDKIFSFVSNNQLQQKTT